MKSTNGYKPTWGYIRNVAVCAFALIASACAKDDIPKYQTPTAPTTAAVTTSVPVAAAPTTAAPTTTAPTTAAPTTTAPTTAAPTTTAPAPKPAAPTTAAPAPAPEPEIYNPCQLKDPNVPPTTAGPQLAAEDGRRITRLAPCQHV